MSAEKPSGKQFNVSRDAARAWRLLGRMGLIDTIFNHISVAWRDSVGTLSFTMNSFGKLSLDAWDEDMITLALRSYSEEDSRRLRINFDGLQLHSCLHLARKREGVVLHTHSPHIIAVSVSPSGLLPISQTAMEFIPEVRLFPYLGLFRGGVLSEEMRDFAENGSIGLLRNHGAVFITNNLEEAVYLAYYFEEACRIQCLATAATRTPIKPDARLVNETAASMRRDRPEPAVVLFNAWEQSCTKPKERST